MTKKIILFVSMFLISVSLYAANNASIRNYELYLSGLQTLRDGKPQDAVKMLETVISNDQNAKNVYKDLMHIYWQLGEHEKALSVAEKLKQLDPEDVKIYTFLGSFYFMYITQSVLMRSRLSGQRCHPR